MEDIREVKFEIMDIDQGYCRVLYRSKNDSGQWLYYCIQQEYRNSCVLYRCSLAPYYEPMYPVTFKDNIWLAIEKPQGETELEEAVRLFIQNEPRTIGHIVEKV
jgi:hypothetical protein